MDIPPQSAEDILTSTEDKFSSAKPEFPDDIDFSESIDEPHTFAKPELARVVHTYLELKVDFNRKVLEGIAALTIEREPSTSEIILDNLGLAISRVTNECDGTCLDYHVKKDHCLRSPLYVQLPPPIDTNNHSRCCIQIEYETDPYSLALYWLTPEQTADGKHPFLLSYNKLMYTRAWFPCQDTPSVKFTYTAEIWVPKNFRVLMSAICQDVDRNDQSLDVYKFDQKNLVPSYAVIIAVGSLEERKLDEIINLFAESKFIHKSFDTFRLGVINKILEIAESLCGTYPWDRYDICVLPPSIAHFEIECPCVIFISPTRIYGDFICIGLFTWNISQSWAGNLVTCSNYQHLWLNMSFNTFIARRIMRKLLIHEDVESFFRRTALIKLNNLVKKSTNAWWPKCLLPNLTGLLPHKVIKYVPYEWGCMFLYHLENLLGGSAVFEPFLQSYFKNFAFKSINTEDWKSYLYQYFPDKKEMLDGIKWKALFCDEVPPSVVPKMTEWETKCFKLAEEWVKWDCQTHNMPSILIDVEKQICDDQKITFLMYLLSFHTRLTTEKLRLILLRHDFEVDNSDIRFHWLLLCIKVQWTDQVEPALMFAIKYCSLNYACPIFKHLYEWTEKRKKAIKAYEKNKEKMLYETQKELENILNLLPS